MANRYWVGGTAAWDGTAGTKWSLTSGGLGGEAVPTSADDVFFDGASTGTCTISTGNTGAKSINCTGFTGTLAGTASITVSGSVTVVSGMTYTYTGILTINAASTLTSGGKTFGATTFSVLGATLTLGDALTLGTGNTFTLTAGTLNLNGNTLSAGSFSSSNTNTRAITFGSANITLTGTGAGATVLGMATATNFSWTGTGGFIRNQVATATVQFGSTAGGSTTNAPNLTINAGASALTITSGSYFKNLVFTGSTSTVTASSLNMAGNLTLASGGTYTALVPTFLTSATFTSAGRTVGNTTVNGSGITLTLGDALTLGAGNTFTLTAGTLDLNGNTLSTGIFSSSNTNTRAITFGSANIALTSTTASTVVLSMATATNFTNTGTGGFTRNMAATATIVFGTTGGTNPPNLTVNAGSSLLTFQNGSNFKNVVFTGSTCSVSGSINVAGNVTLASGGTYTALSMTFVNSGVLTSSGRATGAITVNGIGITVTLADAATLSGASFTLTAGTLDLNGFTLSASVFNSSGANTRAIAFGSGNIALTTNVSASTILSMSNANNFSWTGTGGFTRVQGATAAVTFGVTGGTISNAPNLTVTSGAAQLTITTNSYFNNLTFTGSTCAVTSVAVFVCGNLTLGSGTYTLLNSNFKDSGTITSNSKQLGELQISGSGITVTLGDDLNIGSNTLFLTQGTFTTANFNVAAGSFSADIANTRTLNMGSSTWTLSSNSLAWSTAATSGLTLNSGTSTINATGSAPAFSGGLGGFVYYNLNYGGSGYISILGINTFNNITNSNPGISVYFQAGVTQTVSNFGVTGANGSITSLVSDTPGSQYTLSKTSGVISAQYLNIQDSIATGGARWYVFNGLNQGNNSGWIFNNNNGFGMLLVP